MAIVAPATNASTHGAGSPPAPHAYQPYHLNLAQYQQMAEAGILSEHDPVVLLDGMLVRKMTKRDRHVTATILTHMALLQVVPTGWHVRKEDPIALPDGPDGLDSRPEPDVTVIRGSVRDYANRTPSGADVALVVEVAERSPREDREGLGRFAWAGIPIVWLLNLKARTLEIHSEPTGRSDDPRYAQVQTVNETDAVPLVLDGREVARIAVRELLP